MLRNGREKRSDGHREWQGCGGGSGRWPTGMLSPWVVVEVGSGEAAGKEGI
jgi:hypothetical protein